MKREQRHCLDGGHCSNASRTLVLFLLMNPFDSKTVKGNVAQAKGDGEGDAQCKWTDRQTESTLVWIVPPNDRELVAFNC